MSMICSRDLKPLVHGANPLTGIGKAADAAAKEGCLPPTGGAKDQGGMKRRCNLELQFFCNTDRYGGIVPEPIQLSVFVDAGTAQAKPVPAFYGDAPPGKLFMKGIHGVFCRIVYDILQKLLCHADFFCTDDYYFPVLKQRGGGIPCPQSKLIRRLMQAAQKDPLQFRWKQTNHLRW